MQTLHDLLIRVLLAFCLPAALVATVATTKTPYCAAPPLDITDYGIDFWVQVVFLKRLSNLRETLEYLPLGVQKDIDPRGDVHHSHDSRKREDRDDIDAYFDRLVIAPEFLSTSALFRLKGSRLLHDGYPAVLWPDEYTPDETQRDIDLLSETGHGGEDPTSVFNGFNNVGFDFRTTSPVKISQVKFRIVKVCTPDKNTELQLRGRLHGGMSILIACFCG